MWVWDILFLLIYFLKLARCSDAPSASPPARHAQISNGSALLLELRKAGADSASLILDLSPLSSRVLNLSGGPVESLPPQGSLETGRFLQINGMPGSSLTASIIAWARSNLGTLLVVDFNHYESVGVRTPSTEHFAACWPLVRVACGCIMHAHACTVSACSD